LHFTGICVTIIKTHRIGKEGVYMLVLAMLGLMPIFDSDKDDFIRRLVEEHGDRVYATAYNTLKRYSRENRSDAEDITQEVFIKILKNYGKFFELSREEIAALLVIYTRNTAIDFIRVKKKRHLGLPLYTDEEGDETEIPIPDDSPLPEDLVIRQETIGKCAACIDELPEKQRTVILLKYRYGFKDRQIAEILGTSETVVSSRLNRAREAIRRKMEDYMNE